MSHPEQKAFCLSVKAMFPEAFNGKKVLDIGSLDVNGNNRYLFDECNYLGLDIGPGPNVDVVCRGHEYKVVDSVFDTIISTECFEHDRFWKLTLSNIVRLLKPGGLFLFTCATTGRPEHGTTRSKPFQSPLTSADTDDEWRDYYRNICEFDVRMALDMDSEFANYRFDVKKCDLNFWGIRNGIVLPRHEFYPKQG
jgi:SAM-dependent methyltransferase